MKYLLFLFALISISSVAQEKLLSPKEFLGYELGERFSRHHRVVEYFKHVDQVSPNIEVKEYGQTYEGRPLIYATITAPENFSRLEEIRTSNLIRAGVADGSPSDGTAIVWLSYNVHGNEASSLEASMWTLYELADKSNTRTQAWLKNTVVIMDPCINPDGRDRYANFYNQFGNRPHNPDLDAKEHRENWPGGRTNHYMFDLNRDWAWLTQVESQQRLKIYNAWLPHVHVDFHEQYFESPYYFAPAAEPLHEVISPWQREFQTMIGKNNAKYFDEKGWLYFTKERFDLFYPSYGDTYPTYSGAIGMTYEQGGGGAGGLGITTETDQQLTLKDRLTHHHTTGLSTIEMTSANAFRVVSEFEKYFKDNITNPASPFKSYIITADNGPSKLAAITQWLDAHQIRYGHLSAARASKGFDFQQQRQANFSIAVDDVIIPVNQSKARFITTVFEPVSKLNDSVTYDITAWNLMYSYDLKGYASTDRLTVARPFETKKIQNAAVDKPYAYLFPYQHLTDVQLLTRLLTKGVKVRSAEAKFTVNGKTYGPGTLVITRINNEHIADFDAFISAAAAELNKPIFTTGTGLVDSGKDFGSNNLRLVKAPRVAALFGEQTSSLSSGEIWHFFEQQLQYPITQIATDNFRNVNLSKYDVLIVPEGSYRLFDEGVLEKVSTWVNAGGKLILIGSAIRSFEEKKGFNVKVFASEEQKSQAERKQKELKEKERLQRYADTERRSVSESISGAIYKVLVDDSHPLGFGLNKQYYTLKTNELHYAFLEDGWNVGVIQGKAKPIQGFAGSLINPLLDNSLVFGTEESGSGQIVYLVDNPLFRSFWENGKMLFSNAVFIVGL